MGKKVLGLDLGPNSVGWAIIDEGDATTEPSLIDLGVRVFSEGVDAFDSAKEKSRNEARRVARGMRRQTKRRVLRRRRLTEGLIQSGLWPADQNEQKLLLSKDPYELRARAIDPQQKPLLHEIGRVFLHIARHRGFLSNRKTDSKSSESEGMLKEIQENEAERIESGAKSLGEWLSTKLQALDHRNRAPGDHVRKRHLSRIQYRNEFDLIWDTQRLNYPKVFTQQLKYGLNSKSIYPCVPLPKQDKATSLLELYGFDGLIFFQRKMYWRTSVIGRCELEPKKQRCPLADRRYQKFRILQEVNNIRFIDPDSGMQCKLDDGQRQILLDKLSRSEKMDFSAIRKALGFFETVRFNLEKGERGNIKGHRTDTTLASKNHFGPTWFEMPEDTKNAIVSALTDPNIDELEFAEAAISKWNLTNAQATTLLQTPLATGYGSLSLKAIEKLLPHLVRGLIYSTSNPEESAIHAAGYLRRDQLKRRLFDFLPDPQRQRNTPIGNIPNPVVKRTLCEVRKLVNAIIRRYGKPDAVHVEMARDLQMGAIKRKEYSKFIRTREEERSKIALILRENNQRPTRENILRYMLWLEQNRECIYSGKPISQTQLWGEGGGVEVDHILPRSRTLDDSQANKVLCYRTSNSDKGDRTPYEWLAGSDDKRYEQIVSRSAHLMRSGLMPYNKHKRIIQRELSTDDFVARQLVDTAYITKATAEYVRCLFEADHQVLGLKGKLTAELRWQWGLETVLEELTDSPAWSAASDLRPGEKNRADHRHHALDAAVIALTNRSRLQHLANNYGRSTSPKSGELLSTPWPSFRDDLQQRISTVWVSHRVERKISGALHEETQYGPTPSPNEWVVRKPIESLSANEIEAIRDNTIRELVISKLRNFGIEFGRGKKVDSKKMKEALSVLSLPSGVLVKKVRITKPDLTVRAIRSSKAITYVKPGSTHHLCIFEWEAKGKKRREAVFVTMLEATRRLKTSGLIVERLPPIDHPTIPRDARFVMSLSSRELVLWEEEGRTRLLCFKTAASTQGQIYFAEHSDSRKSSEYKKIVFTANTLAGRKTTVDLIGQLRWAND